MLDRMRVVDERPRVSNAVEADSLIEAVMETLSALSHVVGEETGLVKAGRLKDAMEREARKAMMRADRRVSDSLDSGDDEDDDEAVEPRASRRRKKKARGTEDDVVLAEAYKVLADLVRLNGGAQLPPPPVDWYNAILGF